MLARSPDTVLRRRGAEPSARTRAGVVRRPARRPSWRVELSRFIAASIKDVLQAAILIQIAGAQLLLRFVAAAYERRALAVGSHHPLKPGARFLPEHTTAVSLLDRLLHHCHTVITDGESYRMSEARSRGRSRPGTA